MFRLFFSLFCFLLLGPSSPGVSPVSLVHHQREGSVVVQHLVVSGERLALDETAEADVALEHFLAVTHVLAMSRLQTGCVECAGAVGTTVAAVSGLVGREETLDVVRYALLLLGGA